MRASRARISSRLRSQPWVCASRVLLARAGIVMVVKPSLHLRVVRARVRRLARSTARPRMQPCSTCSGGGRGRTRRRRRRGSSRASQAARRRSKTQPRARAGATSREAVVCNRLIARATKSRSRRTRERDDPTASRRGCGVGCASDGRTPQCSCLINPRPRDESRRRPVQCCSLAQLAPEPPDVKDADSQRSVWVRRALVGASRRGPDWIGFHTCLLYTSPSPRDRTRSRMPSSA